MRACVGVGVDYFSNVSRFPIDLLRQTADWRSRAYARELSFPLAFGFDSSVSSRSRCASHMPHRLRKHRVSSSKRPCHPCVLPPFSLLFLCCFHFSNLTPVHRVRGAACGVMMMTNFRSTKPRTSSQQQRTTHTHTHRSHFLLRRHPIRVRGSTVSLFHHFPIGGRAPNAEGAVPVLLLRWPRINPEDFLTHVTA